MRAIQSEEIKPGDVIPNWMPGKDATVLAVKRQFDSVRVKTDSTPTYRSYKIGRTINVQ